MDPISKVLHQTWDLDSLFHGGSSSPAFALHMEALEPAIVGLRRQIEELGPLTGSDALDRWCRTVEALQQLERQFNQAFSFVHCLTAQDTTDQQARIMEGRITQSYAGLEAVLNHLEAELLALPNTDLEQLLADPRLTPVAFPLRERRTRAGEKLSADRETLAGDLMVDGYYAWSSLYNRLVGRITVDFEAEGKVERLSVGQAHNKFTHPDKSVRDRLFGNWESAWARDAELISAVLNHISGFRLSMYRHRSWESVLKEPLALNRMSEKTLWAMWDAVGESKAKLTRYLQRKASLLGWPSFDWSDQSAPLHLADRGTEYAEATGFITEQFGRFSPRMAEFAAGAFHQRWIEAEDRPGKAPGGFCTDFPESGQCRIFLTYGRNPASVSTLAHELGHAYHTHVMLDLPPLVQHYPMNVAETASTFAELITVNAAIEHAPTREERLSLLDDKLGSAVAYLMNIHARFLFETRFYEARCKGPLSPAQLNELMETAQREAYGGSLGVYHPLFWASKGHFYFTGVPFYNFPYTFGYLFSAGIYARALEEGKGFERRYVDLLRDTGRMTVEDLAARHLGADLTRPDFWLTGVRLVDADVDEFLRLTEG